MERIITLNNFKKLNIASAISLAILAVPAQAVVQIKDDVQLTDETYSEALQWTPGSVGNKLELNNVTVNTPISGHAGVLVYTANGNDISISDSDIKGGEKGYALRFDTVTDSDIVIDNTSLSSNGGNAYIYKSALLSGSNLTFTDSTLNGGKYGILVDSAENSSTITLNNTEIKESNSTGMLIKGMTDSTLNILNGSTISSDQTALEVTNATGSKINIDKSTISGGSKGIAVNLYDDSSLNITNSTVDGGKGRGISATEIKAGGKLNIADSSKISSTNIGVYVDSLTDNSSINVSDSTVNGNNSGLKVIKADQSDINILNGSTISSDKIALEVTNATGSTINVDKSTISGGERGIVTTLNGESSLNVTDSTISGLWGIDVKQINESSLNIANSTVNAGDGRGISVNKVSGGSSLNITDNSKITSEDIAVYIQSIDDNSSLTISDSLISGTKKGLEATLNSGSSLNISDSTLSGENLGMGIVANDSTVAIDNSTFIGASGINFSGHDSNIALSNSQISNLKLSSRDMLVDVAHSDIGKFVLNGQGATESDHKGNNKINIDSSKLTGVAIQWGALGEGNNTFNLVNSEIIADADSSAIFIQDTHDNTINVKDSILKGNIRNLLRYDERTESSNNVINLDNSYFEGAVTTETQNPDGTPNPDHPGLGSTINMGNNTTWVAKGESNAENLNITDSTVDIQDAIVGADNWHSENTNVLINSESQLNIDTGSGDMNVVIKSDGKELETAGKDIINIKNGDMDIQADDVDLGAYKYKLVNKDGKWVLQRQESKEWTELEDGSKVVLSNSANAVLSSLAATQTSWNNQTGAVYERLNSRMEMDEGSVWGTYYGSEWAGEAGLSSTFNQKINGLAIGADKTLPLKDGYVTMGVAVMHDNSHLSGFDEKGSGGSMTSTAVHAYGRLAMDNGLFFKGTASAGSASSKLHANSSDGSVSKGDYKQNLFGLTGQAGYRYQVTPEVYVAPYAQMNGYTASEAKFGLDNGMDVKSDRYWSARGELGVEAGVNTSIAGIAVTPHVMAAAGHEFVKNNDVHLNDINNGFNNTIDGSGYKFGAGVEAQMTKNLSAGVNVNYSRSEDVEQRFGVNAGVRYSF